MTTISDLPPDLESEILSRVPAKSLVELKTTCKRWYTLFKNPQFVKKNKSKVREEEMILSMKPTVYSVSLNLHGNQNSTMEVTGKLGLSNVKVSVIVQCGGLVLCTTKEEYKPNHSLCVWNPCTGQTKMIKPINSYNRFDGYTLGYGNESSCPTYKILRFCIHDYGPGPDPDMAKLVELEIYDFSTDAWRVLDGDLIQNWEKFSDGVSLKGNTYWTAKDIETGLRKIVFFDFTRERFECQPHPYETPFGHYVLSIVREEKLALLYQDFPSVEVHIWVSNKTDAANELSWSKSLVAGFDYIVSSFLVDEGNKLAVCCGRDITSRGIIYIVGEDIHKQVHKEITRGSWPLKPLLLSYVPSLVDIQNDTIERKQKEEETKERHCEKAIRKEGLV